MADPTFTRCPGCATVFRVTPEQLALREGQVRCGHCRAVFDANSHLVSVDIRPHDDDEADELLRGRPTVTLRDSHALQPVAPAAAAGAAGEAEAANVVAETANEVAETTSSGPAEAPASSVDATPGTPVDDGQSTALRETEAPEPGEPAAGPTIEPDEARHEDGGTQPAAKDTASKAEGSVPDLERTSSDVESAVPDSEGAVPEPEGMASDADAGDHVAPGSLPASPIDAGELEAARAALRRRAPRPRSGNTFYVSAMLVLVAGLGVQALLEFHDSLAVRIPRLTPILASACRWLSCSINPLRDTSALSIEGSDLQADPAHQGLLILTATVRNRATYALAYPHLELTLTDASDQIVVRRAFAPSEYLGSNANRDAGIAGNHEQLVRLFIDASTTKQAGYRLYLFYP